MPIEAKQMFNTVRTVSTVTAVNIIILTSTVLLTSPPTPTTTRRRMASGMGLKGNTGRCFRYFEEFAVCMVSKFYKKYVDDVMKMMTMMII